MFCHIRNVGIGVHPACVAYTESSENSPAFLGGIEWKYVDPRENAESTFVIAPGYVLSRNQSDNGEVVVAQTIYAALRFHRSIQYIPQGQKYFTLRNGFPMPTVSAIYLFHFNFLKYLLLQLSLRTMTTVHFVTCLVYDPRIL